jgi:tetratricopeptide (TPR) repeat protein
MNQAVDVLSSAIDLVDELPHAYFTRGTYYYYLGRFEEALSDVNAAAERIRNQFPDLTNYSGLSSYMAILALRVNINKELGDQNLVDEDTKNVAKYAFIRAWQVIDTYIASINLQLNKVCQIKPVDGYYDKSTYLDPNSTCTFSNISLDESAEIQYVVDDALWDVTEGFYRIGTYFDDLALLDSPIEDQLAALRQGVDAFSQGIQYDTAGSSWFYKFLLRNIKRAYGELANAERFPTLTSEEVEYAQSQSAYYAEQEAQLNEQCLEKWTGTWYERYCP